jgi:hypothetical protein
MGTSTPTELEIALSVFDGCDDANISALDITIKSSQRVLTRSME